MGYRETQGPKISPVMSSMIGFGVPHLCKCWEGKGQAPLGPGAIGWWSWRPRGVAESRERPEPGTPLPGVTWRSVGHAGRGMDQATPRHAPDGFTHSSAPAAFLVKLSANDGLLVPCTSTVVRNTPHRACRVASWHVSRWVRAEPSGRFRHRWLEATHMYPLGPAKPGIPGSLRQRQHCYCA